MSSPSLSARQEQMRARYMPSAERSEKRRSRPRKEGTPVILRSSPKRKNFSEACQIGYHYLECPDLKCECTCHNDEYKGEPTQ